MIARLVLLALVGCSPVEDAATDALDSAGAPWCSSTWTVAAPVVTVPFTATYGTASLATIAQAIDDARTHLQATPEDTYVLQFGPGTFDVSADVASDPTAVNSAAFNVSGIHPTTGHLIIAGAGSARTTFVFNDREEATSGDDLEHVCFTALHFAWAHPTVSQGYVAWVEPGAVVLDIANGFPTPNDIYDPHAAHGRYLRKYLGSTDPQLVNQLDACMPDQLPWASATPVEGRRWRITLDNATLTVDYPRGMLVGIKSKHGPAAGAGWFASAKDLVFHDVLWSEHSRVVFRQNTSDVQILSSRIARVPVAGQTPCLSTPEGGPQLGQPTDPPVTGFTINNFSADSTGDDSIAFFNASGSVTHSTLRNAFSGRCILSSHSTVTTDAFTRSELDNCFEMSCPYP